MLIRRQEETLLEPRSSVIWQGMSDWRGGNSAKGPSRANRERG